LIGADVVPFSSAVELEPCPAYEQDGPPPFLEAGPARAARRRQTDPSQNSRASLVAEELNRVATEPHPLARGTPFWEATIFPSAGISRRARAESENVLGTEGGPLRIQYCLGRTRHPACSVKTSQRRLISSRYGHCFDRTVVVTSRIYQFSSAAV